jgi:hypothetical protein
MVIVLIAIKFQKTRSKSKPTIGGIYNFTFLNNNIWHNVCWFKLPRAVMFLDLLLSSPPYTWLIGGLSL